MAQYTIVQYSIVYLAVSENWGPFTRGLPLLQKKSGLIYGRFMAHSSNNYMTVSLNMGSWLFLLGVFMRIARLFEEIWGLYSGP